MSARPQHHCQCASANSCGMMPMMLSAAHCCGSTAASGGQQQAVPTPVLVADGHGKFTSYPPQHVDADETLLHSYGSFHQEPVSGISFNCIHKDSSWALCVPVHLPNGHNNPTLLSLQYMMKYATANDEGNSTIQIDTILTTQNLPHGVVTKFSELKVYKHINAYSARMIDGDHALRLSSTLAVKSASTGDQWGHFIDSQAIAPNVRVGSKAQLYVVVHFDEYPTAATVRSLSVAVSATWQKEEVEIKAKKEAERKAKEEAEKKAKEEAERKAREADEQKFRDEQRQSMKEEKQFREEQRQFWAQEKQAMAEEKQAREEEAKFRAEGAKIRAEEKSEREEAKNAREEEKKFREEERKEWVEERKARQEAAEAASKAAKAAASAPPVANIAQAPKEATKDLQDHISKKVQELGLKPCDNGYAWVKTDFGYQCKGGGHKITFEQLGMK